jgi:hypothetical protein
LTPDQPGQAGSDNAGNLTTASSQTDLDQLSTQLTAAYSAGDQGAISQILAQIENLTGAVSGGAPPPAAEEAPAIARGGVYALRDLEDTIMRTGRTGNLARIMQRFDGYDEADGAIA